MLIAQKLLSLILLNFKLNGTVSDVLHEEINPCKGPHRTGFIRVKNNADKVYRRKSVLGVFITIALIIQFGHGFSSMSTTSLFKSLYQLVTSGHAVIFLIEGYRQRHELAQLFNAFLVFERKYNAKNWVPTSAEQKLRNRITFYVLVGVVSLPFLMFLIWCWLMLSPCFQGNLGYFLIPECNPSLYPNLNGMTGFIVNILIKLPLATLQAWVEMAGLGSSILEYLVFSGAQSYCLVNYILLLDKFLTSDEKDFAGKSNEFLTMMFREVQILLREYNRIHQNVLAVIGTTLYTFVICTASFAIIKYHDVLDLPIIMLYLGVSSDCAFLIYDVDGGIKSNLHIKGKDLIAHGKTFVVSRLNSRQRLSAGGNRKFLQRHIKSWPPAKIYLGAVNYFDESTPTTLIDFDINQVITLLCA